MTAVVSVDARSRHPGEAVANETTRPELEAIVAGACAASESLQAMSRINRAGALCSIADALEADQQAIVEVADRESALGTVRLEGELTRTINQFRLFAEVLIDGAYLEVTIDHATDTQPDLRRLLRPLGPVAVFGASNFPLAFSVPGGDTASALAAGCAVVVKAHPSHPATSIRCWDAIRVGLELAGLPGSTVGLVHGTDTGASLVTHPSITAVGFTGSVGGGRALFDLASSRPDPIPFYGELGSVNPVVVAPAAAANRGDAVATSFVESFTLGSGQFCTKPGMLFIPVENSTSMIDAIVGRLRAVGPLHLLDERIATAYDGRVRQLIADGAFVEVSIDGPTTGTSNHPSIAVVTTDDLIERRFAGLADECFGPFALVVTYTDVDDLTAALEIVPSSLAAGIHADDADEQLARELLSLLERRAGRIVWNGFPTGVAVNWSMHHGGPYPASTSPLHTSVGATAIRRWLRPVAFQGVPSEFLPSECRDGAGAVPRRVDGDLAVA